MRFVSPSPEATGGDARLAHRAQQSKPLAGRAQTTRIVCLSWNEEFPRTASLKVKRRALAEQPREAAPAATT